MAKDAFSEEKSGGLLFDAVEVSSEPSLEKRSRGLGAIVSISVPHIA